MQKRNPLADEVIPIYRRHAASFARDRAAYPWGEKVWFDRFIRLVKPGGIVLDLGCGFGWPVAEYLVSNGFEVTGVDASAPMLAMARKRLPEAEFILSDMRNISLGRTFDAILGWDSFFFLPFDDQRDMFPRFRAHAHSGTILMFNAGWEEDERLGSYQGEPLYHASLASAEYRMLLEKNGFEVLEHAIETPEAAGRTPWIARLI